MLPILLVEDDEKISKSVAESIQTLGLNVEQVWNGELGLEKALEGDYAMVILDVNLPRLSGLEVCRKLREANATIPILMLTARSTEVDRVLGLELGANDYLIKPFSMQELLARVRGILKLVEALKNARPEEQTRSLEVGPFSLDLEKKIAQKNGESIALTAKEFDILALLMSQPGRPFSRDEIHESVWGYVVGSYESNVITHMARLRSKVEDDPSKPQFILNRRGLGYLFAECEEEISS